jgi:YVTN family beta-propeller protein
VRFLTAYAAVALALLPSLAISTNNLYVVSNNAKRIIVINGDTGTVITTIPSASISDPVSIVKKPDDTKIYFTNQTSNTLQIIDTETNTTSSVAVGSAPTFSAITPNGTKVYVSNSSDDSISVLNTSTGNVTTTIAPVSFPGTMAASLTKVYVNVDNGAAVGSIDVATDTVSTYLAITNALSIAFTPSGDRAYVSTSSGNVFPITTASDTVGSAITVGANPTFLAVNPSGTKVYVANTNSSTISIITVASNTVTNTISLFGPQPRNIVFSLDGSKAFVLGNSTNVFVIDTSSETQTATIGVTSTGNSLLAISSDGALLATQSGGFSSISIINAINNQILYPSIDAGAIGLRLIMFATATSVNSPSGFTGVRRVNDFIVVKEYFNSLTWTLSADSEVTNYILKRNGVTIATLGATTNSYEDHNRNPSASDTYTLIAVDASGNESDPITVTVGS